MSLLEDLHAAHKARQRRFSAAAVRPVAPPPVVEAPPPTRPVREWCRLPLNSRPIARVQNLCCTYFNVSKVDLLAPGRTLDIVYPRQVAMYLCKFAAQSTLKEIGRGFGGRDHTTALAAVQKIGRLITSDWMVAYDVAHIEAAL